MKTILSRFGSDYFFAIPPETGIVWFWFGCFAVLLVIAVTLYMYFRAKGFKQKPYRLYAKRFFWPNLTLATIGLVLTFSRYEKLALLSYRFWVYVTILFVVFYNVYFFMIRRNQLEDELLKFNNDERKQKWLGSRNNKKNKTNK